MVGGRDWGVQTETKDRLEKVIAWMCGVDLCGVLILIVLHVWSMNGCFGWEL